MQSLNDASIVSLSASEKLSSLDLRTEFKLKAEQLLQDYYDGAETALEDFRLFHPASDKPDFTPQLLDARQVIMLQSMRDQKLSLEWLKKQAKKLLKSVKSKDPVATLRFENTHPKVIQKQRPLDQLTLADAHHVLALENGFPSWPRLKSHLSQMKAAARKIESGAPLDTSRTLHIRCGNDIKPALTEANLVGPFLEVINPFTIGPVLPDRLAPASLSQRSRFIKTFLGPYLDEKRLDNTTRSLIDEEQTLRNLGDQYDEVVLWFEHDAYDQLCLAYILHHMAQKCPNLPFRLSLVQVDRFPGIKRFVGIGQIGQPEGFALLFSQRMPVTPPMISFGATVWEAVTNPAPDALWALIKEENAPLPLLQNACQRFLAELPSSKNGLGLTENLALEIIAEEEAILARRVFLILIADRDPQPYHGDIMFFAVLDALCTAKEPALKHVGKISNASGPGLDILSLTDFGKQLLSGEANWLNANPTDKWVGGVHISSQHEQNWRYQDREIGPVLV
ncbi:DUF1835 domain-containing protein [Sneathiella aquimaris]|uniref:DUF1835 domain-containing protein n=1 Tax=Sneathiella aquimaris TaxID=2599305 RepID=UPI00146D78C4|nr:DUF1835 domain-containing protein [Sneathiella aquimaris]